MESDFENTSDIENLSDRELRQLVRDRLDEHEGIDTEDITVIVRNGVLNLSGRVGSEGELRVADHIITDQLGIVEYENEMVVDSLRRATSPEAEHLDENILAELEGTTDVQKSIEDAIPWVPPASPTPEGLSGTDGSPGAYGEDR